MFLLLLEPRFEVHVLDKKEHNGWSMKHCYQIFSIYVFNI